MVVLYIYIKCESVLRVRDERSLQQFTYLEAESFYVAVLGEWTGVSQWDFCC